MVLFVNCYVVFYFKFRYDCVSNGISAGSFIDKILVSDVNPFTLVFLKLSLLSLNLVGTIVQIGVS